MSAFFTLVSLFEWQSLGLTVFIFAFCFIVSYASQIVFRRFIVVPPDVLPLPEDSSVICVQCQEVQSPGPACCQCGGALERLENWKWREAADDAELRKTEPPAHPMPTREDPPKGGRAADGRGQLNHSAE